MEPLDRAYERHRISILALGMALAVVVPLAADFILSYLASRLGLTAAYTYEGSCWIAAAAQYCIGYPVCMLMISKVPADPMEQFSMRPGQVADALLACCFVLVAGDYIGLGVNELIASLLGQTAENLVSESLESVSLLYNLVVTVIAAPVFEELICRKLLIDRLNRQGDRPAILLTALMFALLHGNFYQFFYAFGAGLIFAYIYVRTGEIRYTIGLHMTVNLLFGVVPSALYQSEAYVLTVLWEGVMVVLAVAGLVRFIVRFRRRRLLRGWIALPGNRWARLAFLNAGMIVFLILCAGMFVIWYL